MAPSAQMTGLSRRSETGRTGGSLRRRQSLPVMHSYGPPVVGHLVAFFNVPLSLHSKCHKDATKEKSILSCTGSLILDLAPNTSETRMKLLKRIENITLRMSNGIVKSRTSSNNGEITYCRIRHLHPSINSISEVNVDQTGKLRTVGGLRGDVGRYPHSGDSSLPRIRRLKSFNH